MKRRNEMRAFSTLLAMLLVSVMVVQAVSAAEEKCWLFEEGKPWFENADKNKDVAFDGKELVKWVSSSSTRSMVGWRVRTHMWDVPLFGEESEHYSQARDSQGYPVDIDYIKVRGRVWYDDGYQGYYLYFDDSDTHYNSADALVHYEDEHQGTTGTFYARGDHWLEDGEDDKWYPVTTDTLH